MRYGQESGEFARSLDPDSGAHHLLAPADGLTVHVLAGHHAPETARGILQRHVDHLVEGASDRS